MTRFSPGCSLGQLVSTRRPPNAIPLRQVQRAGRIDKRRGRKLRDMAVKEKTLLRYNSMLDKFALWCHDMSLRVAYSDLICAEFLQFLYSSGSPKGHGSDFLSAVQHSFPRLRKRLPTAWRWFGAWARSEPPKRAPPCPRILLCGVVALASRRGDHDIAAAFALMFHCYLRPAELIHLGPSDVKFYDQSSKDSVPAVPLGGFREGQKGPVAVLALDGTKTGGRRAVLEYVEVFDTVVLALLRGWVARRSQQSFLLNLPYSSLRRNFQAYVAALGGENLGLRLYSLRRGGASFDFRRHGRFDIALHRGRWASIGAAQVYLKDAQASAVRISLSINVVVDCRREVSCFIETLRQSGVSGRSELFLL